MYVFSLEVLNTDFAPKNYLFEYRIILIRVVIVSRWKNI